MDILTKRLEKLEAHLSESSIERIQHLEQKLENAYEELRQKAKKIKNVETSMSALNTETIPKIELKLEDTFQRTKEIELALKTQADRINVQQTNGESSENVSTKESKRQKIKEKAKEFLSTFSVYGISRIIKADNLMIKLMWTALLLVSVTLGFIIITNTVTNFINFDVITNVERITDSNMTFPAITICTENKLKKYSFNKTSIEEETISNYSIEHFIDFNSSSFKSQPLNSSQLEYFEIPEQFGNCLRFNGFNYNKSFEFVSKTTDLFKIKINKVITTDDLIYGFFDAYIIPDDLNIYVGDNYLNTFLNTFPFTLKFGKQHKFTLEKAETEEKLGRSYNECEESLDDSYRQMNCIEDCINREVKEAYNCSIPSYFKIKGLKYCHFTTRDLIDEFYGKCERGCDKECTKFKYRTSITSLETDDEYDGFSTTFDFSVSDFSTLHIKQIPKMSFFDLISSIGGSLSIFIGIRFLSMVELLEFFVDLFYVLFIERFL